MIHQRNDAFEPVEVDKSSEDWTYTLRSNKMPVYDNPANSRQRIVFLEQPNGKSKKGDEMSNYSVSKTELRISVAGTLIGFLAIACGTTWTISNSISEQVDKSRLETNNNLQVIKTELSTTMQNNKMEMSSRLDKIDAKIDSSSKDNAIGIAKIQSMLENNSKK
ncbi:hypothetical protein EYY98_19895 [Obesumbacterium proteus]|nr:hypothetical protein EYY98_19895 [Obesumbacterium proteus]